VIFPFQNFLLYFVMWILLSIKGSEVHSVTYPNQSPITIYPCCNMPKLMRLWGRSHSGRTVPSYPEEMPQNMSVQRLHGGSPITGLPSSRLVTYPRELSITFNPQCKDLHTVTLLIPSTPLHVRLLLLQSQLFMSVMSFKPVCVYVTYRRIDCYCGTQLKMFNNLQHWLCTNG
jgi:hypothetical protein